MTLPARLGWLLACLVVVFGGWELVARGLAIPSYLLPPPSLVAAEFAQRWQRVLEHSVVTTTSMLLGYGLAVVIAIPLAVMIAWSRRIEAGIYPIVVFLQILPKIAIAPLFIVWFGFGLTPKVLLVFLLSFFPIVAAALAGLKAVDAEVVELARSTGAGALRIFWKIRLPSALPEIFTGLKVAAALAATAAVVAEFVAADRGLGYLLLVFNGELMTPMVFATVLLLGVLGLALFYAVELVQRLMMPWHVSTRIDQDPGMRV